MFLNEKGQNKKVSIMNNTEEKRQLDSVGNIKTHVQMKKDKSRLKNLLSEYRDEMITNITFDNDLAYLSIEKIDKAIKVIVYALKPNYEVKVNGH